MSSKEIRVFAKFEPACWGSNELPLIPPRLSKAIGNHSFTLRAQRSKKLTRFLLNDFTAPGWAWDLRDHVAVDEDELLGATLIREFTEACRNHEDKTDIPIFPELIYGWSGINSIPLRISTLEDIWRSGLNTSDGIATHMSGTFLEAFQHLGSWESVLDLVITTVAWISPLIGAPKGFFLPNLPESLEELEELLRIRCARNSGVPRTAPASEMELWDAIGGRFGIDLEGQWTLELSGDHVGLTRERFRQIMKLVIWDPLPRQWPYSDLLEPALNAIENTSVDSIVDFTDSQGNHYKQVHGKQIRLIAALAGVVDDPRAIPSKTDTEVFSEVGTSPRELHDAAFHLSERMGFVQEVDLRLRITEILGEEGKHLIDEALTLVSTFSDLPHGYVYVDGNRTSFTFNTLQSLLSLLGPLKISEAHAACVRNSIYRAGADFPYPPVSVFRDWLLRDDRFEVERDHVKIPHPVQVDLGKVQGWMKETIESSPGCVIHRTMLYELGRRVGVRPGTLNVYCSFNPYFRPAGSNCITLTGLEPSQYDIQQARHLAAEFKVKNQLLAYHVENGNLRIRATAGTEMCDSGLFGVPVVVRRLLGDSKYKALFDGNQHGHISLSGNVAIGFSSVLVTMNIVPGDQIEITFDLSKLTATFEYLTLVNVDLGPE